MGCLYKVTCLENGKAFIGMTLVQDSAPLRGNAALNDDLSRYDVRCFKREVLW